MCHFLLCDIHTCLLLTSCFLNTPPPTKNPPPTTTTIRKNNNKQQQNKTPKEHCYHVGKQPKHFQIVKLYLKGCYHYSFI